MFVDPAMVKLENFNYDSWQTVYFQRGSVITLELLLVFALSRYGSPPCLLTMAVVRLLH